MLLSRQTAIETLRKGHLLRSADTLRFFWVIASNWKSNRAFLRDHKGYPVPPLALAFDAYGHVNRKLYYDSGVRHARVLASILNAVFGDQSLSILEWGCGPGRVIRHLQPFLSKPCSLMGSDINKRSIAWCRANLAPIRFTENSAEPPLPFESGSFDGVICRSVFTHLSEPMYYAWWDELIRILKHSGIIILTTHGEFFKHLHLGAAEKRAYEAGRLVIRDDILEGRKWYTAFHPATFMRKCLLKDLNILLHVPGPVGPMFEQDIWVVTPDSQRSGDGLHNVNLM